MCSQRNTQRQKYTNTYTLGHTHLCAWSRWWLPSGKAINQCSKPSENFILMRCCWSCLPVRSNPARSCTRLFPHLLLHFFTQTWLILLLSYGHTLCSSFAHIPSSRWPVPPLPPPPSAIPLSLLLLQKSHHLQFSFLWPVSRKGPNTPPEP